LLLENAKVVKYLAAKHADLLTESSSPGHSFLVVRGSLPSGKQKGAQQLSRVCDILAREGFAIEDLERQPHRPIERDGLGPVLNQLLDLRDCGRGLLKKARSLANHGESASLVSALLDGREERHDGHKGAKPPGQRVVLRGAQAEVDRS